MYWPAGVMLLQNAILLALWILLPLLIALAVSGAAGAYAQSYLGWTDPGALLAPKIIAAGFTLAILGTWMLGLLVNYWGSLWLATSTFLPAK